MMRIYSTILFCCCALWAGAQNLSNRGKEFWVGYGHHQFMEPGQSNSQEMVLYFSAEEPANVTVTINGTSYVRNYTVPANSVIASEYIPKAGLYDCRLYSVPPTFGGTGGEGLFTRGIHIVSDVPIVAYAHIFGSASSGATMLMPVETWGYVYSTVNSPQNYGSNNCFSWVYVVAQEDNTVVEITPSVPTRNGRVPGVPFYATLNKGEIYQVIGAAITSSKGYEMTGTHVKSIANSAGVCHPIGVFAGSSRTAISCPVGGSGSGDNIMQQIFPFQAWGKRYLTAPFSKDNSASSFNTHLLRIAVKDPTTVVKVNGVTLTSGLINNFYYQLQSNTADYIEADKPILVAQYMPSSGSCGFTGYGDPEMIYLSPIEQAIKRVGFYRNVEEAIRVNYLTLIIPTDGLASLKIDGSSSISYSYPHPNLPGYTVVVKRWSPAAATQCIVESDSAFTAITYGLGSVESYGYNAGTLINNLNVIGSIHNQLDTTATSHKFTCTNTPVDISLLIAYKPIKLVWLLSAQAAVLSPATDVTDNNPIPVDSVLVSGVKYYKYTLPQTYSFNSTGEFEIPVLSTHPSIENCNNTEKVKFMVEVKGKPTPEFSFTHTGCTLDTVYFATPDTSSNGFGIARWNWSFPGGEIDSGNAVKHVLPAGTQTVQLTVVSAEGCLADTSMQIVVNPKPVAGITASAASICEGGNLVFTDNSNYADPAGINAWYWDFDNGDTATVFSGDPQTVDFPAYDTVTVKHVVRVSDLCISDTAETTVIVYANPTASFDYPVGCLPADGIVQFNNTSTTPDGQPLSSYAWNFADPDADATNPNTSTLANPTHVYTAFGPYDIVFSVSTAAGCTDDTTVKASFHVRPQFSFDVLSSVCEDMTGTVSVAKAGVTNGVTGTHIYKGPGTDADGNFSPSVAGAGTHTIWYVFTSDGGCTDSVSQTIRVHPKPNVSFTVNSDICLDQQATFTDASTIASGNIATWSWDFGDGSNASYTNGNVFSKSYSTYNDFTVKLTAVSDSGCSAEQTQQLSVHPMPVADFELPEGVCMPGGEASFTNLSTVPGNGALNYQWDFGDGGAGSNAASPVHYYASSGSYPVSLTATTTYGCAHAVVKTLSAFYDKPVAAFTVAPDTLCQGSDNEFTNSSTAPNSTVQSWQWEFGDGTSSTDENPVKRYTQPGDYNVQLTVMNAVGCASDPFTKPVIVYLQPVIDAGPSFVVPQGTIVQFGAEANDSTVLQFSWTPAGELSQADILRPQLKAVHDETYTLTAKGEGDCIATDNLSVKILRPVNVPNAFSPNGDGINDTWVIRNLSDYPGCTVEVYNRYGQRVFYSAGYGTPWKGGFNGNPLPVATYYYVIRLENGFAPITGSVTILR
jgi:gliding motility-associated-like protein